MVLCEICGAEPAEEGGVVCVECLEFGDLLVEEAEDCPGGCGCDWCRRYPRRPLETIRVEGGLL